MSIVKARRGVRSLAVVFFGTFIILFFLCIRPDAVQAEDAGPTQPAPAGSKWMVRSQFAHRDSMVTLPVPAQPQAPEKSAAYDEPIKEEVHSAKKAEPTKENIQSKQTTVIESKTPDSVVSKQTIKYPKDVAPKPFFNLNFLNTDKPRINIGRHWFSWFKKEESSVQIPTGQILSLDECITIAERNNIQLQVARDSIKLAQLRLNEAKRNLLPSATLVFDTYTGEINSRQYVGRKQYIEGQQPVFRGGELVYSVKQAKANLDITKIDCDRIRNELTLQVKKAYYSLGKARENLKIQQQLHEEVMKIKGMVEKEAEFMVTSRLEALNVASQANQVEYQLITAEGDTGIAELMLKQTMNVDPNQEMNVQPDLDFDKIDVSYEEALRAAYKLRPEIKANALMLHYYSLGKKIAKAKGWPKIDILGSWGLAKEEFVPEDRLGPTSPTGAAGTNGPIFDVDQKLQQQFYAGVKASMPFWGSTGEYSWTREQWVPVVSAYQGTEASTHSFKLKVLDNLAYYSERAQSEAEYDRARQELNKTKQDVTLEVKEGCFSYQKALQQLETSKSKVKYQQMDVETTRFRRGLDEVQDSNVVDSLVKLAQEKYSYAQALADCHTAIASINKAIGASNFYKDKSDKRR